jgi:hypothetical protein
MLCNQVGILTHNKSLFDQFQRQTTRTFYLFDLFYNVVLFMYSSRSTTVHFTSLSSNQLHILYFLLNRLSLQLRSTHSIAINFCWSSSAQLFLVSDPVGTREQIFVRSKTICVFGNGAASLTRGEVSLLSRRYI